MQKDASQNFGFGGFFFLFSGSKKFFAKFQDFWDPVSFGHPRLIILILPIITMADISSSKKRKTIDNELVNTTAPPKKMSRIDSVDDVLEKFNKLWKENSHLKSFSCWNEKGGVGKTHATVRLAWEYAHLNPESQVLIIDLSTQGEATHYFLGEKVQDDLLELDSRCESSSSMFSYFLKVYDMAVGECTRIAVDLEQHITAVNRPGECFPSNIAVCASSLCLTEACRALERIIQSRGMIRTQQQMWIVVQSCLKNSLIEYQARINKPLAVFIDHMPELSLLTSIGMVASKQWIVPLHQSGPRYSLVGAIRALHGPSVLSIAFAAQAKENNMQLPYIAAFIYKGHYIKDRSTYPQEAMEETLSVYENYRTTVLGESSTIPDSSESFYDCHHLHKLAAVL